MSWAAIVAIVVVLLILGVWWWVTKIPADRHDSVSQAWRDEHKREGRH